MSELTFDSEIMKRFRHFIFFLRAVIYEPIYIGDIFAYKHLLNSLIIMKMFLFRFLD